MMTPLASIAAGFLFSVSPNISANDWSRSAEFAQVVTNSDPTSGRSLASILPALEKARASQIALRELLFKFGQRVAKEQVGSARGHHNGISGVIIFGFGSVRGGGGSFEARQDELLLKGGETFLVAEFDDSTAALLKKIDSSGGRRAGCAQALKEKLELAQARAASPAAIAEIQDRLNGFQETMRELDEMIIRSKSAHEQKVFDDLKKWAVGSRVIHSKLKAHYDYVQYFEPMFGSPNMEIKFETFTSCYDSGLRMEAEDIFSRYFSFIERDLRVY